MWWLLAALSMVHLLGTTHYFFGKRKPDNPEINMNISEIIAYWGYPNEEYEVITEDGYVLRLNRIPYGKNSSGQGPQPVTYLQHGLLTSASDWILNLPNNSLAFMLADAGYDVWMGNSRGNAWSRKHVDFSPDSSEFWAFSFDEMAKYDLPATINFILEMTGHEQLYYVGHSQGSIIEIATAISAFSSHHPDQSAAIDIKARPPNWQKRLGLTEGSQDAFIAFSTDQALAQKVKALFALSPISAVKHMKGPLNIFLLFPKKMLKILFGDRAFFTNTHLEKFIATQICGRKVLDQICVSAISITSGCNQKNLNMSRLDVYLSHLSGTSIQTMLHWLQVLKTGQFQAYDWGSPVQNMMHFNQRLESLHQADLMLRRLLTKVISKYNYQTTPPFYRREDMTVPAFLWSGGNDLLVPPKDVEDLLQQLPNLRYHKMIPSYKHLDFIWGMDAAQQIYSELIEMMKQNVSSFPVMGRS